MATQIIFSKYLETTTIPDTYNNDDRGCGPPMTGTNGGSRFTKRSIHANDGANESAEGYI